MRHCLILFLLCAASACYLRAQEPYKGPKLEAYEFPSLVSQKLYNYIATIKPGAIAILTNYHGDTVTVTVQSLDTNINRSVFELTPKYWNYEDWYIPVFIETQQTHQQLKLKERQVKMYGFSYLVKHQAVFDRLLEP